MVLLGMLLASTLSIARAGLWENIDDYVVESRDISRVSTLIAGEAGDVYAVVLTDLKVGEADGRVILRKLDGVTGAWSNLDDFQYSSGQHTESWGADRGPDGAIYLGEMGNDAKGVGHWLIRKVTATDATTLMDYQLEPGFQARGGGVTVNAQGIFTGGYAADGVKDHGIVRRSRDGGGSWETVLDVSGDAGAHFFSMSTLKGGAIVALGHRNVAGGGSTAIVYRSDDGGSSWALADEFLLAGAKDSFWERSYADRLGNLYLSGEAMFSDDRAVAVVRKFTASDGSWKTIDVASRPDAAQSYALAVAGDGENAVYAAIREFGDDGIRRWVVRASFDGGANWEQLDRYAGVDGAGTGLWGATVDSFGQPYFGGSTKTPSGTTRSLVRRYVQ